MLLIKNLLVTYKHTHYLLLAQKKTEVCELIRSAKAVLLDKMRFSLNSIIVFTVYGFTKQ